MPDLAGHISCQNPVAKSTKATSANRSHPEFAIVSQAQRDKTGEEPDLQMRIGLFYHRYSVYHTDIKFFVVSLTGCEYCAQAEPIFAASSIRVTILAAAPTASM